MALNGLKTNIVDLPKFVVQINYRFNGEIKTYSEVKQDWNAVSAIHMALLDLHRQYKGYWKEENILSIDSQVI